MKHNLQSSEWTPDNSGLISLFSSHLSPSSPVFMDPYPFKCKGASQWLPCLGLVSSSVAVILDSGFRQQEWRRVIRERLICLEWTGELINEAWGEHLVPCRLWPLSSLLGTPGNVQGWLLPQGWLVHPWTSKSCSRVMSVAGLLDRSFLFWTPSRKGQGILLAPASCYFY